MEQNSLLLITSKYRLRVCDNQLNFNLFENCFTFLCYTAAWPRHHSTGEVYSDPPSRILPQDTMDFNKAEIDNFLLNFDSRPKLNNFNFDLGRS